MFVVKIQFTNTVRWLNDVGQSKPISQSIYDSTNIHVRIVEAIICLMVQIVIFILQGALYRESFLYANRFMI